MGIGVVKELDVMRLRGGVEILGRGGGVQLKIGLINVQGLTDV